MKSVEPWELNMFDPQLTISKQMEIGDSFLLFSFSFSNCVFRCDFRLLKD